MNLSWDQVIGRRLTRHHLLETAVGGELVTVTSDICGAHSQIGSSAELMLGLRVRDITRKDVRAALAARSLVKTVGLRGTLHLFPAEEIPFWAAANRLRFPAEDRRRQSMGIDLRELSRVLDVMAEVVGPEPISRIDFEERLESKAGGWALATNQGFVGTYKNWPMAMEYAAAMGLVCYGPSEGGRISLVRLKDWIPWREVDPTEGGLFAVRRFLRAYGPSTVPEFSRWFALDPAIAKQLFAELSGELVEVSVAGRSRWMLQSDLGEAAEAAPDAVHLLPQFDVFVVGSHPRDQLVEHGSAVAVASPGTAAPLAVLLVGGRVSGVWERKAKGKRLVIRVDAHRSLSRAQKSAVEEQARRVAQIMERDCDFGFGEVALKRHL